MSLLQALLLANIVLQLLLFYFAVKSLSAKKYYRKTLTWLFPFGAYVWDDMLPISIFWLVSSVILIFLNDWILTTVLVLLFFILRWFYEVFYWFFQQFHTDNSRPNDFGFKNLPNQNIYIIYQVINLCQATLGIFALFLLLTKF